MPARFSSKSNYKEKARLGAEESVKVKRSSLLSCNICDRARRVMEVKMKKNLFLFLLNLLLVGCSVNQDALVSSSSDPEPTINSTSVPNVDQRNNLF